MLGLERSLGEVCALASCVAISDRLSSLIS